MKNPKIYIKTKTDNISTKLTRILTRKEAALMYNVSQERISNGLKRKQFSGVGYDSKKNKFVLANSIKKYYKSILRKTRI